jgi:hypothetical protein
MNSPTMRRLLPVCLALALSPLAPAHQKHDHSHDHDEMGSEALGAHEHGAASLNVAVDGTLVSLEFHSAAYNIVGFEHAPKDDAQRKAIADATAALKDPVTLFGLTGCTLKDSQIDAGGHGADSHDHDHDHEHGHDHAAGGHVDYTGSYTLECTATAPLALDAKGWFARFPATETLKLQYIGTQQGAAELTAAAPVAQIP